MSTLTHVSNDVLRQRGEVEVISAAQTLTAADSGKVFVLDAAAGATVVLPALEEGLKFKFVVGAAFATTNWVIDSAEGDNINGIIADMGATVAAVLASGEDQVNFVATAETIGDHVELIADYANSQWLVSGVCGANGGITVTDPS
jgi:hypothetical protein